MCKNKKRGGGFCSREAGGSHLLALHREGGGTLCAL